MLQVPRMRFWAARWSLAVPLLRVWWRCGLSTTFGFWYRVGVHDPHGTLAAARSGVPTIFLSPHRHGAYDHGLLQWLVPRCHKLALVGWERYGRAVERAIPVVRHPATPSQNDVFLREAARVLEGGGSLWVAPEGTITRGPALGKQHTGFARIALAVQQQVRIVPCTVAFGCLDGGFGTKVYVALGAPIMTNPPPVQPAPHKMVTALRDLCAERLVALDCFGAAIAPRRRHNERATCDSDERQGALNAWLALRALEAWCGFGPLPLPERLWRLRQASRARIPVPSCVVDAVRVAVNSQPPQRPHPLSLLLPSPVGLPRDFVGVGLFVRSWHWRGVLMPSGDDGAAPSARVVTVVTAGRGHPQDEAAAGQVLVCPSCYQRVPPYGCAVLTPAGRTLVRVVHWHVGVRVARDVCSTFVRGGPGRDARWPVAIVPHPQSPGTLHVLVAAAAATGHLESGGAVDDISAFREVLRSLHPLPIDHVLPCPGPGHVLDAAAIALAGAASVPVGRLPGDSALLRVHAPPSDAAAIEKQFERVVLRADLRAGEVVATALAMRAPAVLDLVRATASCGAPLDLLDVGGSDGRKTMGVAAFLGWPLQHVRVWETAVAPSPATSPGSLIRCQTLRHSDSAPFVEVATGVGPSLVRRQAPGSAALVLLLHVLHHVTPGAPLRALVTAVAHALAPGGAVVVMDHDVDPIVQPELAVHLRKLHVGKDSARHPLSPPRLRSRDAWAALLSEAGLQRALPLDCEGTHAVPLAAHEADPGNSAPDPRSHPNATFLDVFVKPTGPDQLRRNNLQLQLARWSSRAVALHGWARTDLRDNAWSARAPLALDPGSGTSAAGLRVAGTTAGAVSFAMHSGKWARQVQPWLSPARSGHLPSVLASWADTPDSLRHTDVLVCTAGRFPAGGFVGRLLEPQHAVERLTDRAAALELACLASRALRFPPHAHLFRIPPSARVDDDSAAAWVSALQRVGGLPAVAKSAAGVFVAATLSELRAAGVPCDVQRWEASPTGCRAVYKIEVVGDAVAVSHRRALTLSDSVSGCPAPRVGAAVSCANFSRGARQWAPPAAAAAAFGQALRRVSGLHLVGADAVPVVQRDAPGGIAWSIVDVNAFPGYKDFPDVSRHVQRLLVQAVRWRFPPRIVLLGPSGVADTAVELARRLQCPVTVTSASTPRELVARCRNSGRAWPPFGVTSVRLPFRPAAYTVPVAGAAVVRLSAEELADDAAAGAAAAEALAAGVVHRCRLDPAETASLPEPVAAAVGAIHGAGLSLLDGLRLLTDVVQHELRIPAVDVRLAHPLQAAGDAWAALLRRQHWQDDSTGAPTDTVVAWECAVAYGAHTARLATASAGFRGSRKTQLGLPDAGTASGIRPGSTSLLARRHSVSDNENEFWVVETQCAYEKWIRPALAREPLPHFLAELFALPVTLRPHERARLSTCGQRLWCCIDVPDGHVNGGWLLTPNPKYLPPRPVSVDQARQVPWIAYWIPPRYYGEELKDAMVAVAVTHLDTHDYAASVAASTVLKPHGAPYLHTIRDVTDARVLTALHEGAAEYFRTYLDLDVASMLEDAHYLPQLRFSTLHVHYRSRTSKTFHPLELPCRHALLDVVAALQVEQPKSDVGADAGAGSEPLISSSMRHAAINVGFRQYGARFNGFHGIWQLVSEFQVPAQVLDFGPSLGRRAPVLLVGCHAERADPPAVLIAASLRGGSVQADLLCPEAPRQPAARRGLPPGWHMASPSAARGRRDSISSHAHDAVPGFVFEAPDAYTRFIRTGYAAETLPAFLAAIFTGDPGDTWRKELRVNAEGVPLYAAVANDHGSGWFLCSNPKFLSPMAPPPTREMLAARCAFVAWWVAPCWFPGLASRVAAAEPCVEGLHTWDRASNVANTAVRKPADGPGFCYLHTIRDLTSPAVLLTLVAAAGSFFGRLGISLESLGVADAHYPPALKYSTLHIHFRTALDLAPGDEVMRYPIAGVADALRERPNCLADGTVRFWYPHHSGRSIAQLVADGALPAAALTFGTRRPPLTDAQLYVGKPPSEDSW